MASSQSLSRIAFLFTLATMPSMSCPAWATCTATITQEMKLNALRILKSLPNTEVKIEPMQNLDRRWITGANREYRRIQIVPQIQPHRTHGGFVPDSSPHRVRHIVEIAWR